MAQDIRLLVADADTSVRDIIRLSAAQENWNCDDAADGITALKLLRRNEYHLAVLDTELPDVDGLIVCRHLRKGVPAASPQMPVIFISRNGNEVDRLAGFSAGGNDYVIKPFFPRELIARIKNLLKICGHEWAAPKPLVAGRLQISLTSRGVTVDGRTVRLTPKEFDLLVFFCQNPGQAFSRDSLLDLVWGQDFFGSDRTVDTHVKSLRGKIRPCDTYIQTVWGYGYKFEI